MKINKKCVFVVIICAIVIFGLFFMLNKVLVRTSVYVTDVIDGDTLILKNGKHVRLIGINAPEKGDFYYEDAKKYLCSLVCNKKVILERDKMNKDRYGRLLRYVWVDGFLINEEILREGLAHTIFDKKNKKYWERLVEAEIFAMNAKKGIWKSKFGCLAIHEFNYNADGDDCKNPNDEYILFRNFCRYPIDLGGYTLRDMEGNLFVFPNITLGSEEYIKLHSGFGKNNQTNLFWNLNKTCPAVWNNDGDKMFMRDPEGYLVLYYEY